MGRFCGAILISLAAIATTAHADQPADATAILDAAIKAAGGDKLAAVKDDYAIAKITFTENGMTSVSFMEAWFEEHRERTLMFDQDHAPTETDVVNGSEGWTQGFGAPTETMSPAMLASQQDLIYASWATNLVPLKGSEYKLSTLDEIDVNGKRAVGLLVEREKFPALKMYFDKQTYLLAKLVDKFTEVEPDKTTVHDQECVYSDYRDCDGIQGPFKLDVSWDGKKVGVYELQKQIYFDKPQSDKLFEKP